MNIFIDIDGTICETPCENGINMYEKSTPIIERIEAANRLYKQGNNITYWTARGNTSGKDYSELTKNQLDSWGCKYHHLNFKKPSYDIYIDDKSHNVNSFWCTNNCTCKVQKGWGFENIFVNNEKYCGKILHFYKGGKFSMHFHLIKEETWYVSSGKFLFRSIDTSNAEMKERELKIGDVVTNKIGQPHQLICLEEGEIFEVSTQHFDYDSYRVMKGDSQV